MHKWGRLMKVNRLKTKEPITNIHIKETKEAEEHEIIEMEILPEKIICPDCGGITLQSLEFCDKCGGEI